MYGKTNKMNTMKKGGRKNITKFKTADGGQIKIKYGKDGLVKKKVKRDASGNLSGSGKIKYKGSNEGFRVKKMTLPKSKKGKAKSSDPNTKIKFSKYREGGASEGNYSYQDFLDL